MTFRVGQKVVCIKRDPWRDGYGTEINPQFGAIYTIRHINSHPNGAGLMFFEIVNPVLEYREGVLECDFKSYHFRPVVERKTDISIFTSMLNPSKVDA